MKNQDQQTSSEPLEDNLSQLICKDNLPPVPDQAAKLRMLNQLKEKQANLIVEEPKNVVRWAFALAGIAAAVVAVFGTIYFSELGQADPAPVVVEKLIEPSPVEVMEALAYDAAEKTQRIELRDGSVAIAEMGTRFIEISPRQLKLEVGSLYLMVAKAEKPLVVETPQGKALALGTRFLVSSEASDTKVAVAQGRVELQRSDEEKVELLRGEEGVLGAGGMTRRAAPRISHLVSWARDHLRDSDEGNSRIEGRNGLIAVDPQGQESRLSLRKYVVDVFIENGVARTTIDQTFFNHYHSNTEGTFYFPLPPGAAVSRLAMYVNGVRNEGGMVERNRGQQIYNDIKYENRDPALLEHLEGNLYKLRIFPLEGRQEKRLFLSFTQSVDELYRTLRYWLPMDHTQDSADLVQIKVRVKDGEKLYEAESSTHDFVKSIEEGDLFLSYEVADEKPDQDLLLKLIPKNREDEIAETAILKRKDCNYLHTRIRPELTGEVVVAPRQWFILNDTSASRSEEELQAQAHIVERLLAEADDEDQVAIANLNIDVAPLMNELVLLRAEEAKSAVRAMQSAQRVGATNIAEGLKLMREWIERSGAANPHLIYLGDGLATDGAVTSHELAALLNPEVPFLGIAVGKKADMSFLREAANVTDGGAYLMNPDEDLNWRVFDLLASLNTPRLTGLSWQLPEEVSGYGDRSSLAAGEALSLVMASEGEFPKELLLRGELEGLPWEKMISLEPSEEEASFIPRFWAQRHLEELLKDGDRHRDEVVRLSKKHYVATPFTSLIVLENDKMYEDYKVEKGRSDHWAAYPAPEKIAVVREPLPYWRWDGRIANTQTEKEEVVLDPQTAEEIIASLLSTKWQQEHGSLIDQVSHRLYRGEGFYNSGLYDKAESEFRSILHLDPYNIAARRWMERCSSIKSNYYGAAYDQTQAEMLMQVERAWELALPEVGLAADSSILFGSPVSRVWVRGAVNNWSHGEARGRGFGGAHILGLRSKVVTKGIGRGQGAGFGDFTWSGNNIDALPQPHHAPILDRLPLLIPAFATFETDRVSAVEVKFGRKKRGSVTDEASELLRAAEAKRKPVRLAEGIVTPNGRVKGDRVVEVYLAEETVADEQSWYHIYRELGFATKRPLTPTNRGVIQAMVPHWPPSLAEMEARWIVTLVAQDAESFEISLVDPDDASRKMEMVINREGLLLRTSEWQGETQVSARKFRYEGETVSMTDESGQEVDYQAVEIEVTDALFAADLEDLAILDLPLRKPAYYRKQLEEVKGEPKKQLIRHLLLAQMITSFNLDDQKLLMSLNEGDDKTPFDHETLRVMLNYQNATSESCDFFQHFKEAKNLSGRYNGFAIHEMRYFIEAWPDSPYLFFLALRCQNQRIWIDLLDFPEHRAAAIERLVEHADRSTWKDFQGISQRVADFLIEDAEAGNPQMISKELADFLGREQAQNESWKRVVAAYQKAGEEVEELEVGAAQAVLDLAIKEKDEPLVQRCFDYLQQEKAQLDEQSVLADIFASHGRHKEAVALYRKVFVGVEKPDPFLLKRASLSAKSFDEKFSLIWQREALKAQRESEGASDEEVLFYEYADLQIRALETGDEAMAKEVTLEGYELLPDKHELIAQLASYFAEEGQARESWRWLSSILDRNVKNAEATGAIAAWYEKRAEWDQAEVKYAEAHSFDSAHPQWLLKRVNVLYRAGELEKAEACYRELVTTKWADQLRRLVPGYVEQSLTDPEVARFKLGEPEEAWIELSFDDSAWKERSATFLARDAKSPIWTTGFSSRQIFELGAIPERLLLQGFVNDAECKIYLNGALVHTLTKKSRFNAYILPPSALQKLQIGENIFAVKYRKTGESPRAAVALTQQFTVPNK